MLLVVRETLLQQITLFSTFLTQDELARKSEKIERKVKEEEEGKRRSSIGFSFSQST